jgi:hypothetical protein
MFQGLSIDISRTGIQLDAADPDLGVQFTNTSIAPEQVITGNMAPQGAGIVISKTFTSHARFTNGAIWGISPAVKVSGSGSVLLSSFAFNDRDTDVFSVDCSGGAIAVRGCQFLKLPPGMHVRLGGSVTKAILYGNIAPGSAFSFVTRVPPTATLIANNL